MQGVLHLEEFVRHVADLIVPRCARALEGEIQFAELADIAAQVAEAAGETARVPCGCRADGDDADDAHGEDNDEDMVDVVVQVCHLSILYRGLNFCRLAEEAVDLVRLLAQFGGGCGRRLDISAAVECDDLLCVLRVVTHCLAQLLTARLAVGVDRVLGEHGDLLIGFLECRLRGCNAGRVTRDDVAAQFAQPQMKVILCLEQGDAVLDRDGEQMLILGTRRLELIEHNAEQDNHQRDDAADESRELQSDGHSLSHKNHPHFFFPHRAPVPCGHAA